MKHSDFIKAKVEKIKEQFNNDCGIYLDDTVTIKGKTYTCETIQFEEI